MNRTPRIALVAVATAAALSLTGCSAALDLLRHESELHADDLADLRENWRGAEAATWLPKDATDINLRESDDGSTAVLRVDSSTELDPALCAETERLSFPAFVDDWTPDDEALMKREQVWACGEWAVAPVDGGWFGWTPSAAGEQEAAP